jgi:uncharacterized membrane protein
MPDQSATLPAARRHRARTRPAGVADAAAAAVAVWLVARYGAGLHPHTPGFSSAQRPASLTPGFVAVLSAAASVVAWAALRLIERIARRPRRVWIITGLITLAVSLSAPLSGHGVTGTDRLALICMHLAVAIVLVPIFALTISPGRPAKNGASRFGRPAPFFSARRQQAARSANSGRSR